MNVNQEKLIIKWVALSLISSIVLQYLVFAAIHVPEVLRGGLPGHDCIFYCTPKTFGEIFPAALTDLVLWNFVSIGVFTLVPAAVIFCIGFFFLRKRKANLLSSAQLSHKSEPGNP